MPEQEVSQTFRDAFIDGGGIVCECGACERVHFEDDPKAGDWEEGELEGLRKKASKEPDKYFPTDGDVKTVTMMGCSYVVDCPCGELKWIEEFIWQESGRIARYLLTQTSSRLDQAKQAADLVKLMNRGLRENEKLTLEVNQLRARLRMKVDE